MNAPDPALATDLTGDVTLSDLTTGGVEGTGVFDLLMRAGESHVHQEFGKGRLKGAEYSQVYLGLVQSSMSEAIRFLLERHRAALGEKQISLVESQIESDAAERARTEAQTSQILAETLLVPKKGEVLDQEILKSTQEVANLAAELPRIVAQTEGLEASTAQTLAETTLIPKRGLVLDQEVLRSVQEVAKSTQEVLNLAAELPRIQAQTEGIEAATAQTTAETVNVPKKGALIEAEISDTAAATALKTAQALIIPKEGELLDKRVLDVVAETALKGQQLVNLTAEKLGIEAMTALKVQERLNAITEETVLVARECKLKGEFDVLTEEKARVIKQVLLIDRQIQSEAAQTDGSIADPSSVLGRQISLYEAQRDGFHRDAEQKAAEILIDAWRAEKTVDAGAIRPAGLNDSAINAASAKLLAGI